MCICFKLFIEFICYITILRTGLAIFGWSARDAVFFVWNRTALPTVDPTVMWPAKVQSQRAIS
jgi:hypothetical protein